jgi:4-amino-4-deoxy-L-arabinose transferase-like glycosyltransferase
MRCVALSSDAYGRLDWSAALLTDEGFYIHNARNVALFGHPRTDGFNNMLLAPLLHAVQVAVFTLFGVGAIQARLISVVSSVATLLLLWAALRRVMGERVALTAAALLALDHTNLLYNRLALMDTPAALAAVAAFYAFVRGCEKQEEGEVWPHRRSAAWLLLSGVLLGATVTNRMLAAYLVPAPFIALSVSRRGLPSAWPLVTGLAAVAVIYVVGWYWPHRAEIAAMNHYYRTNQIQPHSAFHLWENVRQAFVGDFRGISPYLFRHTPIVYSLALAWLVLSFGRWRERIRGRQPDAGEENVSGFGTPMQSRPAVAYLVVWFVLGWVTLAVISYSPSRYYVTLYPAMASLAAAAVWQIPAWLERARKAERWERQAIAGLIAFGAFHAALAVVHYRGLWSASVVSAILTALAVAVAAAALAGWSTWTSWLGKHRTKLVLVALGLWLSVNLVWMADWAFTIDYSQTRFSHWLGTHLPAGSVLIGDVAPGVTMDNSFRAIHVQPGLANDEHPVERFAGSPRFVVILAGRFREAYWDKHYPWLTAPERMVTTAHLLRWDVGVYSVEGPSNSR